MASWKGELPGRVMDMTPAMSDGYFLQPRGRSGSISKSAARYSMEAPTLGDAAEVASPATPRARKTERPGDGESNELGIAVEIVSVASDADDEDDARSETLTAARPLALGAPKLFPQGSSGSIVTTPVVLNAKGKSLSSRTMSFRGFKVGGIVDGVRPTSQSSTKKAMKHLGVMDESALKRNKGLMKMGLTETDFQAAESYFSTERNAEKLVARRWGPKAPKTFGATAGEIVRKKAMQTMGVSENTYQTSVQEHLSSMGYQPEAPLSMWAKFRCKKQRPPGMLD